MTRRLIAYALVAAALMGASGAQAAKATPALHAAESVKIAAPPAKVWAIVENFSDLTWHPAIKKSSATNGNTPGSVRTLDLGGPVLMEELTRYNAARHSYSYKFTDDPNNVKVIPAAQYHSTITVKPAGHGMTLVTWTGKFRRVDPSATPAAGQDDASAVKAVTGVYRGGLDNLKTLAERS